MKIHFRKVIGRKLMFLELPSGFLPLQDSKEPVSPLPGDPIEFGDMPNKVVLNLRRNHFLEIDAQEGDSWGNLRLSLPSPVDMFELLPHDVRQETLERAETVGPDRIAAIFEWWEYLRRSKSFQADCASMRDSFSTDEKFIRIALIGGPWLLYRYLYLAGKRGGGGFPDKWGLPSHGWPLFLSPESTGTEDLVKVMLSAHRGGEGDFVVSGIPLTPERGGDVRYFFTRDTKADAVKGVTFLLSPCTQNTANAIASGLFRERLLVEGFEFIPKLEPWGKGAVYFAVKADADARLWFFPLAQPFIDEDWERGDPGGIPPNLQSAFNIVNRFFPMSWLALKTWKDRKRQDPLVMRRELAAFDGRKDLDAELWPGLEGDSLRASKSRAAQKAKRRISNIEKAADKRRAAITL